MKMFSFLTPNKITSRAVATAAAPAPEKTMVMSSNLRSVISTALNKRSGSDHRRSVLVIMEDRNVEFRLQPLLDLKALWCANIF